jgi:hypothetical protein
MSKVYGRSKLTIEQMHSTKEDAEIDKHAYFFTGKPCKHNHVAPRRTINGGCHECHRLSTKKYYIDNKPEPRKLLTPEEKTERTKTYRSKNRDKIKEYQKTNKEKIKAQKQIYYQKNKEALSKKRKAYYQENKLEESLTYNEYYKRNRKKILERKRTYYLKNRESILEKKREYRKKNK